MTSIATPDVRDINSRGIAAMRAGDFKAAEQLFEQAVALDPKGGGLWRNLAHARREQGDDARERAALQSALDLDLHDLSALIRMAELLERTKETRDAIVSWEGVLHMIRAMTPIPDNLKPVLDHAIAYCSAERDRIAAGIEVELGDAVDGLDQTARRRARAFIEHAVGGRPIYRNECLGLYYPFLPADEFFDDRHFPWFADMAAAAPDIRAELEALLADPGDLIKAYVRQDKGTPENKWTSLDHNLDWSAIFLWEFGVPNQPVLDRCPRTAAALDAIPSVRARIPARAPSAMFSLLKPHTRIPPHTGVSNTRAVVHLPLVVPPGCGFRVGGETRQWVEGVPFAFDDTIEHEAWNDSDLPRTVLIFDVWNPHLTREEQDVIARYYAATDRLTAGGAAVE